MAILLRLFKYAKPYRYRLISAYCCLLIVTGLTYLIPWILGLAIDSALENREHMQFIVLAFLILSSSLIRGLFTYGQHYLSESTSQLISQDLRNSLFQKYQGLSFSFHDQQHTGDLMSRATADIEAIRWVVSDGILRGVSLITMILGITVILFAISWELASVSLSFIPFILWRGTTIAKQLRICWLKAQEALGGMTTVLQESITGIQATKSFNAETYEHAKFESTTAAVYQHSLKASLVHSSNGAFFTFIFSSITGIVLFLGIRLINIDQTISPGQLAQFIFYLGLLAPSVRMAGWIISSLSRGIAAGDRFFKVIDADSYDFDTPKVSNNQHLRGEIELGKVHFSYSDNIAILKNLNLKIPAGTTVVITGEPGSGKSTLLQLLLKFYNPQSGMITIDETEIASTDPIALRYDVGIVFQDPFLFSTTILDNIRYGKEDATMAEVVSVSEISQLHQFVMTLPQQYETLVGERGITLSGGQKQRLAIARCLLSDPKIILLDDATSNIDVLTESKLLTNLFARLTGKTTIIATHRFSSTKFADLIIILQNGTIQSVGTHSELMVSDNYYKQLYAYQNTDSHKSSEQLTEQSHDEGLL
ncbi:MAG: hypothetical protein CL896_04980 [Dehalococcoidia bacterium]|nr:hypothetical protein [Dehalococcoidia bacterium]